MAGPTILTTAQRRSAGDFIEGVMALSQSLARQDKTAEARTFTCPWNDSNFDAPRRLAWQNGWDWACAHPEPRRQMLYMLTGKWGG